MSRCIAQCGNPAVGGWFAAQVLSIIVDLVASRIVFRANGVTFVAEAPRYAMLVRFANMEYLEDSTINVSLCHTTLAARGQHIGAGVKRHSSIVHSIITTMLRVVVVIEGCDAVVTMESGGCLGAALGLVNIFGNTTDSHINVVDSRLAAATVNGTVATASVAAIFAGIITMATSLVNVGPFADGEICTASNLTVNITNSVVACEHSTSLPTGVSVLFVASLLTAVIATTNAVDSAFTLSNVSVQRLYPTSSGPSTWFPQTFFGVRQNATAIAFFVDARAAMPRAMYPFVGTPIAVVHTHVTISLSRQCTVGYGARLLPTLPDVVGLLVLPTVVNTSRVSLEDAWMFPNMGHDVAFGMPIGLVGGVQLINSVVDVRTVSFGPAALLFIDSSNVTVDGATSLSFTNVSVRAPAIGPSHSPVTSGDGVMIASSEGIPTDGGTRVKRTPLLTVMQSQFVGFDQLLDLEKFRVPQHSSDRVVVALGCNLWDGVPLPIASVGYDAHYEPSVELQLNVTDENGQLIACAGLRDSAATTSTDPPVGDAAHIAVSTTAASLTTALVYLAAATNGVGRGGPVQGLQRSMAALRLSARCSAMANSAAADDPPMFSQRTDNPLGLSIPVGLETLRFAAGAAVGNMLLVCIAAGVLHAVHAGQRQQWASSVVAMLLRVLPSCPLPASFAAMYGQLNQPAVGACVVLLLLEDRDTRSMACGCAMLLMWMAYPTYCMIAVMWRGRRDGVFILTSRVVVVQRRARGRDDETCAPECAHRITAAVRYASAETREWAPHQGCSRRGTPERAYAEFLLHKMEAVFGAFVGGREWYFAVDWGIAAVSGAVLGAAEAVAVGGSACAAAQWGGGFAVAISALQLLLCLWLRPHSVRLELWMAVLLGCLELLSNALSLAGRDDDANTVVTAISLSGIGVLLISVLLSGIDAARSVNFVPRNVVRAGGSNIQRDFDVNATACVRTTSAAAGDWGGVRPCSEGVVAAHAGKQLKALILLICGDAEQCATC